MLDKRLGLISSNSAPACAALWKAGRRRSGSPTASHSDGTCCRRKDGGPAFARSAMPALHRRVVPARGNRRNVLQLLPSAAIAAGAGPAGIRVIIAVPVSRLLLLLSAQYQLVTRPMSSSALSWFISTVAPLSVFHAVVDQRVVGGAVSRTDEIDVMP